MEMSWTAQGGRHESEPVQEALINMLPARRGHFLMESGYHGDLWLDLEALFLRPGRLRRFAVELANRLAMHKIEAVCGPLIGGAFMAQMIAVELDVECYYAERSAGPHSDTLYSVEYRLPHALRGNVHGKNVAFVDDVINAGSAVRATATDLHDCGAKVVAISALLVLGDSGADFAADNDLPLERIAYLPSVLWAPSECPLCAVPTPLEDVTGRRLV